MTHTKIGIILPQKKILHVDKKSEINIIRFQNKPVPLWKHRHQTTKISKMGLEIHHNCHLLSRKEKCGKYWTCHIVHVLCLQHRIWRQPTSSSCLPIDRGVMYPVLAEEKIFKFLLRTSVWENITEHRHHGGDNYAEEQAPPVRTRMLQAGTQMTRHWHTLPV